MKPYVVRKGEYLTKLGHTLGFDPDEVWAHDKNQKLRDRRSKEEQLEAGDVLWIPDEPRRRNPVVQGDDNRYSAWVPRVPVRLVLKLDGNVLADEPYVIRGLPTGEEPEKKTGPDGVIALEVSVHVHELRVVLPARGDTIRVLVGDMDPIEEASGLRKRLRHLGYYSAPVAEGAGGVYEAHDAEALAAAIATFQKAHGLEPTGIADDATRDKLIEVHGS